MVRTRTAFVAGVVALVLVAGAGGAAADEAGVTIVREGRGAAVVVIPDRKYVTRPVAWTSSQTLVKHVARMSGATLGIVGEEQLGKVAVADGRVTPEAGKAAGGVTAFIIVGEGGLAKRLGVTSEGLGPSGIRIRTTGNAVVLVGSADRSDGRSTQHAVFEFLEVLGCRSLWPGPTGKVTPKRATITVKPMDLSYTPAIGQRHIRSLAFHTRHATGLERLGISDAAWRKAWTAAFGDDTMREWTWWHRLGGNLGIHGGHAFGDWWERYGKAHPEWFALQADGTRDQTGTGTRERLCVSNTGLIDAIAADIIERVKKKPDTRSVSLSPNDGGYSSFCMCDACKALDAPEAPKVQLLIFKKAGQSQRTPLMYPSLTDRYVWFWNGIAERVTATYPKLLMVVDAYSAYNLPPVKRTLHPNLVVRYVPSTADGWDAWRLKASKIFWRPNILNSGRREGTLLVYGESLTKTFNYVADNGAVATDFDSILHYWAVHGLNYYAAARLNWRPDLTWDAILDDYCSAGFGKGAAHVRRYFTLAGEATDKYAKGREPKGLGRETIAALRALLNDAERAAGDDEPVRKRIAFLRLGLNITDLQVTLDAMAAQAKAGKPFDKARAARLMTLNFVALRDIALNHHLAVSAAYLMWGTGNYAKWRPLGWTGLHQDLLKGAAAGTLPNGRLTGREDSLAAMAASLGVGDGVTFGRHPSSILSLVGGSGFPSPFGRGSEKASVTPSRGRGAGRNWFEPLHPCGGKREIAGSTEKACKGRSKRTCPSPGRLRRPTSPEGGGDRAQTCP